MGIDLSEFSTLTPEQQDQFLAAERAKKQSQVNNGQGEGFGIKKGENLTERAKSDEETNPSKPNQG